MNIRQKKMSILFVGIFTFFSSFGQNRILDVSPITQTNTNWCWAATIAMISNYYSIDTTMCQFVEYARRRYGGFGNSNCCGLPTPTECNKGMTPLNYTQIFSHVGLTSTDKDPCPFSTITFCINDNRPFLMECSRGDGSKHQFTLIGYDSSNSRIYYLEPADGSLRYENYNTAITSECLGAFYYRWTLGATIPTTSVCTPNRYLHQPIGATATIHAQSNIVFDGTITNNSNVTLIAGNSITLSPGFGIQLGSSFSAIISATPCQ